MTDRCFYAFTSHKRQQQTSIVKSEVVHCFLSLRYFYASNPYVGLGSLLYRLMLSYVYSAESLAEAERARRRRRTEEAKENGLLIHQETQVRINLFRSLVNRSY